MDETKNNIDPTYHGGDKMNTRDNLTKATEGLNNKIGNGHAKHTAVGDSIRQVAHKVDEYGEAFADKSDQWVHNGERAVAQFQETYLASTADYIKQNPMKATLIAAGIGWLLAKILKI